MPQCPICNAAVWVGQRYCSTCDHPLPRSEGEEYFCPQCGASLASPKETCQKCQVPLPEIIEIPLKEPARTWRMPFKIPGFFIGAGLIIVALFLFFFFSKSSESPQLIMTPPSKAVSEQPPSPPPVPASEPTPAPKVATVQEIAVPAATAATSPPEEGTTTGPLPRYFVTIEELSVRDGPNMSYPRIGVLKYKTEVELLDTSGGWGKVRDVERDIVGWSYMRYLQPVAPDASRAVSGHQASDPQEPESIAAKAADDM